MPRSSFLPLLQTVLALAVLLTPAQASAQYRVMSWNVARLFGDDAAMAAVFAAAADDDKPGFAVAPHLVVLQEVRAADVNAIEAMLDAIEPGLNYARATFTTSSTEDGAGGAQALFYRDDAFAEIPSGHQDLVTGANRKSDRWLLQPLGYSSPAARIYVYSAHLKAGNTPTDAAERLAGAQVIRDSADALPAGTNILYVGDWNVYSNTEGAYLEFLSAGNGRGFDPLGSGPWSGAANAGKHTQSPRDIVDDGLIGGGMDDRFDFQVPTAALQDGAGLSLLPGSYRTMGNDGAHYNLAVNAGNNGYFPGELARSNALADLLFAASDHLPILSDFTVPAIMGVSLNASFGRVIQGASFAVTLGVTNAAEVVAPDGADPLAFSVATSGAFLGSFAGTAPLSPATANVTVPVLTATVGAITGTVTVTTANQAAQNATMVRSAAGTVVRRSNPSFSAKADVDARTVAVAAIAGGPPVTVEVAIANHGFNPLQATLDVDAVLGLGAGVSLAAALPQAIGATPGTLALRIDPGAIAPGTLVRDLTVVTSDEDLPGEDSATLALRLEVTVASGGNPADLDGNGHVDAADLGRLLANWGGSGEGDLDGSGVVGAADLAILLAAWG
jgi:endonuclease/exonuclease/phosphatase family metal-dependent hydrolase